MNAVIETRHLSKTYPTGKGCKDITLKVRAGQVFGLLGPNGAGKSTLVKTLVGLLKPTGGEARILGFPLGDREVRRHIGYLPELFRYQDWLSAEEVLRFHAQLGGLEKRKTESRIREVLREVGLRGRGQERVRNFFKGMQQRLGLACALLLNPPLLFLDEPASALDPLGRHEVRQLLCRLRQQGKTVFLNTHQLEDVEAVCDEVAFLLDGQIRQQGTVASILRPAPQWEFVVGGWMPECLETITAQTGMALTVEEFDEEGHARLCGELKDREQAGWINALLVEQGLTLYESRPRQNHLEDWFLTLAAEKGGTGHDSSDDHDVA